MSSIDERVVQMKFKDSSFQDGVKRTLEGLKNLKDGLKLDGATKGLEEVGKSVDDIDLTGLESNLTTINPLFIALGTIGVTALSRLTNAAIDFGKNIVANVMEPLFEGGRTRALNLESARYSFKMLGIDATEAMNNANYAVEGTAYSLDVAAKAASQLSASQVKLGEDMKASLRGISGVAALTNSSYEDISEIFTKIAGQGRLMGDDLNRLGSRGMNAAAVLAKAFNTSEQNLRKMVSKGQISFKEFAKAMDDAYGEKAVSAAETYSGALGQMRTAIARIGADIQAAKLEALRRIYNALAPAINGVKFAIQPLLDMFGEMQVMKADNLVKMLEDIVKVGFGNYKEDPKSPLVALQEGFKNIADSILNVVRPIREAWNQVFPPSLGGMISKFSFWFRDFTGSLKITGDAAKVIKAIFVGLFSTLKLGLQIVGGILGVVFNGLSLLFRLLGAIGSVITPVIKYIYNFVAGLKLFEGNVKRSSNAIDIFFNALKWAQNFVLEPLIAIFKGLGGALDAFLNDGKTAKDVFGKLFTPIIETAKKVGESFGIAGDIIEERFGAVGTRIRKTWEGLLNVIKAVGKFFEPIIKAMKPFFTQVRDGFAKMLEGADFNTVLATINTGVILVIANTIRKAVGEITGILSATKGIGTSFKGVLDGVTGALGEMQKKLKADAILMIAISIGIMAASLALLASIEPDRMISAAVGLGVVAGALLIAVNQFSDILKSKGLIKMPLIAYSMILLGTAMITLATAVKIMGKLKWDELLRGLGGLVVALGGLLFAANNLSKLQGGIARASGALMLLSLAILALTGSIAILGHLKMEVLVQGLVGITIALGLLVGAAAILSKNAGGMTAAAGGILAMATAMGMLVGVITIFGLLPIPIITQGMVTLGLLMGGLVLMAEYMSKNAGGMTKAAGGILAMAIAIGMLVSSIVILGLISMDTLIQGLIGVAAALTILVVAARATSGIDKGIAGMIALAGALLILAIGMKVLSTIPVEGLITGLIAIVALLAALGLAGLLLGPVAPQMMLVAGAIALLAVALALISGAVLVFTIALAALGPAIMSLVGGLTVFADASDKLLEAVPAMLAVGAGLIVFGLGAAAAGIGIAILGTALILMGAGLALIGAVGLIGATALTAVALSIVNLLQYAGQLVIMGGVLTVLGTGLIAVGVGGLLAGAALVVIGAGMLVIAGALFALGPAMVVASSGLMVFLPLVGQFVNAVPGMIALGVGLTAFGIGAGLSALGIMALGAALVVLGAGLMLVTAAGSGSAKVIKKVTETVAGLWGHALNIGIVATALAGLGASLLVLGAGLGLVGISSMVVIAAFMAFIAMSSIFAASTNLIIDAIKNLSKSSKTISKSAASLTVLGSAIAILGAASLAASNGIIAISVGFAVLSSASSELNATIVSTSKNVQTSSKTIITSINSIPPEFKKMATQALSAFDTLVKGINKASVSVKTAGTSLGNTIKSTVSTAINSAKSTASTGGQRIGTAITDGMVRGLNNGRNRVSNAARNVAKAALASAKQELDSHSPSKKFLKLGEDSSEGYALGLEGQTGRVVKAAATLGGSAVYSLQKSISDISNSVAIDPNMRPTITPILDLSLVKKDAPLINGLLKSPTLNVSDSYRDANSIAVDDAIDLRSVPNATVTNVAFTQNNNSPKALTEAEIYRQTNNQIARLEKGVGASNVD